MANVPAHHLILAIGVKPGGAPPSVRDSMMPQSAPAPAPPDQSQGVKASPEDAGLVTADQRCGDCEHWSADSGQCEKVDGMMTACAGCRKYFTPKGMGSVMGMPTPGGDADDQTWS